MDKPPERKKTPSSQSGKPLEVLDDIVQQLVAIRDEGNERGEKLGRELASLKTDFAGFVEWKEKLERSQTERIADYTKWRTSVDEDRTQVAEKATAATDAASEKLRDEMKSLRDHVTATVGAASEKLSVASEQLSVSNRVSRGMSQALGLNYDELARIPKGLTTTQANRIVTPPRATLTKLSKQQMASMAGQIFMIIILLLQILLHTR